MIAMSALFAPTPPLPAALPRVLPTSMIGLVAYGAAAVCCGMAWIGARTRGHRLTVAGIAAVIEAALFADTAFNGRWALHGLLMGAAQQRNLYAERKLPQAIGLAVLACLSLAAVRFTLRAFRGRPGAALASCGLLGSLVLWSIEVISLHQVDGILYRRAGPFMSISFLWAASALITSIGILIEARRTAGR